MLKTGPGSLPDEMSFFSLSSEETTGGFRLSALKRSEDGDGVIVRFFNTIERPVRGSVESHWLADGAFLTNLNEEEQQELKAIDKAIEFEARQKEIVTLKLKVAPRVQEYTQRSNVDIVLPPLSPGEKWPAGELPS